MSIFDDIAKILSYGRCIVHIIESIDDYEQDGTLGISYDQTIWERYEAFYKIRSFEDLVEIKDRLVEINRKNRSHYIIRYDKNIQLNESHIRKNS